MAIIRLFQQLLHDSLEQSSSNAFIDLWQRSSATDQHYLLHGLQNTTDQSALKQLHDALTPDMDMRSVQAITAMALDDFSTMQTLLGSSDHEIAQAILQRLRSDPARHPEQQLTLLLLQPLYATLTGRSLILPYMI